MKYYDERKGLLKDKKIVAALKQAAEDYENGEILEVCAELEEITSAIYDFSLHEENTFA